MKKTRQLHLWIGLICSVFILLESITGLLLSEKGLLGLGGEMGGRPQAAAGMNVTSTKSSNSAASNVQTVSEGAATAPQGDRPQQFGGGNNSFLGIVKGLHEGRIGQTDVKWLIDLTAIGMIVLTVTGITLSIKTLRAQRIQRKRRSVVAS